MLESLMLEIYFLLAHEIKGLGWSLKDFWEADTWTTSKLYCMELELLEKIESEPKESEDEKHDSEEMKELYEEMFE